MAPVNGLAQTEPPKCKLPVLTTSAGQSTDVNTCMQLITEHRTRHLPVMQGEELVGLVSIGDLVAAIIADQQITIEQLESYIATG